MVSGTIMTQHIQTFFYGYFLFSIILCIGGYLIVKSGKLLSLLINRITMCCSNFLVMAVTMERYFAVCRPLHFREVSSESFVISLMLLISDSMGVKSFSIEETHLCSTFHRFSPSLGGPLPISCPVLLLL